MSILGDIGNVFGKIGGGVAKGIHFVVTIFTKIEQVASVVAKLSPKTLSAILAVFYDLVKIASTIQTDITEQKLGDIFSDTTKALFSTFITDLKAGEQILVDDAKALGLAITSDSTPTT